ncbi:hypothetical protein AQUSIP_08550 [Aquicella siphonis]|uniref:TQO small subunit DoxD domain-containing protein n=1 Tax=Aquicella siphonis TaxID=254247 RepID=A0A5E4PG04_9COXI|nr:TQO small subunit DoxD [Aquicella siphonis]VVC75565.1 hypothetical protein AQUSIP_08550 [Aquicella siphonis]
MNDSVNEMNAEHTWKHIGLVILSIRFVQGWIFWGGGSRRFIYDPEKLDPYSSQWMANKLQSAMPGAMLGLEQLVSFMLQHFILLYTSIILFSLVELICGLNLVFGFFTRVSAFMTALISIALMLLFGWQGSTCMDEWTMAAANLSIGLTLALSGGSWLSVDHFLAMRHPALARKCWFIALASGPLSAVRLKQASLVFLTFSMIFTLLTYNYLRGSVFTPYHSGPVSTGEHHLAIDHVRLQKNGSLSFNAYVDAGTPGMPAYIIRIELADLNGSDMETWTGKELSALPAQNIRNYYAYNRITTGPYGLVAPLSAKAEIVLPAMTHNTALHSSPYQLRIYTVSGKRFTLEVQPSQE